MAKYDIRTLTPADFARLETEMWIAYYRHNFFKLFRLLFELNWLYFKPNPFLTVAGAYYSAAAAIVFRKTKGHENSARILALLIKFYALVSKHDVRPFDAQKAAELELEWWMVDRYPDRYKMTRATALAEAGAVVYHSTPAALTSYGQNRAAAMELLGAHHSDSSVPVDWPKVQSLLLKAYQDMRTSVIG